MLLALQDVSDQVVFGRREEMEIYFELVFDKPRGNSGSARGEALTPAWTRHAPRHTPRNGQAQTPRPPPAHR